MDNNNGTNNTGGDNGTNGNGGTNPSTGDDVPLHIGYDSRDNYHVGEELPIQYTVRRMGPSEAPTYNPLPRENATLPLEVNYVDGDTTSWGLSGGPNGPLWGPWIASSGPHPEWDRFETELKDKWFNDVTNARVVSRNGNLLSCIEYRDQNGDIIVFHDNISQDFQIQFMYNELLNHEASLNLNDIAEPFVNIEVSKGKSKVFRVCLARHLATGQVLFHNRWDLYSSVVTDNNQVFGTTPYQIDQTFWFSRTDSLIARYMNRDRILKAQYRQLIENSPILNKVMLKASFRPLSYPDSPWTR